MAHIFLFTWEETYLLQQELRKRRDSFLQKYGQEGYISFHADELDPTVIQNTLFWGGMFSDKRLIVIRWIPKDTHPDNKPKSAAAEKVESFFIDSLDRIPEEHVVVLVSYKPDRRTKSRKYFSEHTEVKTFAPLSEKELTKYIWEYLTMKWGLHIDISYFLAKTGENLMHIIHECDKLIRYAQYNKLTQLSNEQLDLLVVCQTEVEAFGLLDTLFTDTKRTLQTLTEMEDQNEDSFKTLWLLYRWLKLVLGLIALYQRGMKDSKELASQLKTHPFPVLKQLKHIVYLQEIAPVIRILYNKLLTLDYNLKTGILPQELFWTALKSRIVESKIDDSLHSA